MNSHAFGIGCFHFGYKKAPPYEYSDGMYIDDLEKALSSIPSISDIEISYDKSFASKSVVTREHESLSDGILFPNVLFLRVEFLLFIPYRVQKDLALSKQWRLRTGTENFSVTIVNKFYGPVAYVECINAGEDCEPSDAVQLLRKYLSREFSKLSSPVTFEYLGPSPFHANFYTKEATDIDSDMVINETKRHGYNDFVFQYNPEIFQGNILDRVYYELSHEIDLFYEIQRYSVNLINSGDAIVEKWHGLRELVSRQPNFLDFKSRYQIHKNAQNVISGLYEYQAEFAEAQSRVDSSISSMYSNGTGTYLESYIKNKYEQLPSYPIDSLLKWVEHIESVSFKSAEILAIIMAALLGGIVGSLVTATLSLGGS